ncbi:MAG: hypothetical protein ACK4FK_18100 [Ferrovibrio sp.]|uniref:hypothetical protein n=1 Tax=Ferrovibrio sp. TaxID=1917215 RepID=UPI00391AA287
MAAFSDYRAHEWDNRRLWLAVALSLLLHGLVVLMLLVEPWTWRLQPEPPPVLAEFVLPPPPKAEPPRPVPQAEAPKPEPELPRTELPPPSVPQLQRAPVAEESRAPPSAGERARPRQQQAETPKPPPQVQRPGPGAATAPQPRPPQAQSQAGNRQPGAGSAGGPPAEVMTQSESDFFLSQIVQAWVIDFDAPQFADIRIVGPYLVLPNGMLAPPFGKNDPWDMDRMVDGWPKLQAARGPQAAAFRTALETFLRAMRLAQPLAMPPNAQGYPKILYLDFRIGDL